MEHYIGGKNLWERNILVPRALILLTNHVDQELSLQAQDDGQAQFVDSQIYDALQKISSTEISCFQLWSQLEFLIHGTGQKDENKKKNRKIWYESGRKNHYFFKNMRYTKYTELI